MRPAAGLLRLPSLYALTRASGARATGVRAGLALTGQGPFGSSRPVQKSELIWLDGAFVPWDEAKVHVLTHTLHYGLGAFEGIRCYQTKDGRSAVFRLHEHTRRLFASAHILEMTIPFSPA